jgi:hypothetical protein
LGGFFGDLRAKPENLPSAAAQDGFALPEAAAVTTIGRS